MQERHESPSRNRAVHAAHLLRVRGLFEPWLVHGGDAFLFVHALVVADLVADGDELVGALAVCGSAHFRRGRRRAHRAPGAVRRHERARCARADQLPWSNPAVLTESIDRGGTNVVRGGRRLVRDLVRAPHLPASVDVTKFAVGGNLARSPGSVVLHTDVFDLIHYRPATERVRGGAPAACPTDDQQALHPRYRPGAEHGRIPDRPRPPGVHDLLA